LHTQTVASGPLQLSFPPLAQTSSYANGGDMSELQAHRGMTPITVNLGRLLSCAV